MNPLDAIHEEAAAALRASGKRYTQNRSAVVSVLAKSSQPLTIEGILEKADGLFSSSTYRSLAMLVEAGVVRRLSMNSERSYFELSEHLGEHHHHLLCRSCGVVADVVLDSETESAVERGLAMAAGAQGFTVDGHTVDAIGRCAGCSSG